jgi:hypothetical protein
LEHDAYGIPLKYVYDAGAIFGAAQHDPATAFDPLKLLIAESTRDDVAP